MKTTFNYRKRFSYTIVLPALVFLALGGYCYVEQAGVAFKNWTFLLYPNSAYILGGIGLVWLLFVFKRILDATSASRSGDHLVFEAASLVYHKGGNRTYINYGQVQQLAESEDEDDGKTLTLFMNGGKDEHTFVEDNFDSPGAYKAFFDGLVERTKTQVEN